MSQMAKDARAAMRAKATRMAGGDPRKKVDASSWMPTEPLNTTAKTGARPIRPRIYKHGGTVQGDRACRADRKARATGGKLTDEQRKLAVRLGGDPNKLGIPGYGKIKTTTKEEADEARKTRATGGKACSPEEMVDAKVNRDVVKANADKFGKPHVGAFKKGGKARKHRDMGGPMQDPRAQAQAAMAAAGQRSGTDPGGFLKFGQGQRSPFGLKKGGAAESYKGGTRPTGGRLAKAKGGASENMVPLTDRQRKIAADVKASTRPPDPDQKTLREGRASGGTLDRKERRRLEEIAVRNAAKMRSDEAADRAQRYTAHRAQMSPAELKEEHALNDEGYASRNPRASGGRAKGKTNINIVIAQPHGQQPQQPPNMAPVRPPPPQMPPPPPQAPPGIPPAGGPGSMPPPSMMGGAGGGMPMMPRKSGGRTVMHAGAGSGEGRLEKIELQKHAR